MRIRERKWLELHPIPLLLLATFWVQIGWSQGFEKYLETGGVHWNGGSHGNVNDKMSDIRSNGFVYAQVPFHDPANEPSQPYPILFTTDFSGEYDGLNIRYEGELVTEVEVITLKNSGVDNGYLLLGDTDDGHNYFFKTNLSGTVDWAKKLELQRNSGFYRMLYHPQAIALSDGNILVTGAFFEASLSAPNETYHLFVMKLDGDTGAILWRKMYNSPDLPDGFFPRDLIEYAPGDYYLIGGRSENFFIHRENFIVHMQEMGTIITTDAKRINLPNSAHVSKIIIENEEITLLGNNMHADQIIGMKMSLDLNTITDLSGTPNNYSIYDLPESNKFYDAVYLNDRLNIAFSSPHAAFPYDENSILVLESDGTILHAHEKASTMAPRGFGHSIYTHDNILYTVDLVPKQYGVYFFDIFRVASYTPLGIGCNQEPLSMTQSTNSVTINNINLSGIYRNANYFNFTLNPVPYAMPKYNECPECELTAADVGPITTSTGGTSLCDEASIVLTAPSGYTYQWFFEGTDTGVTAQNYTATEGGTYSVIVTDAEGCSVELVIEIEPGIDPAAIEDLSFCLGFSHILPELDGGTWSGPFVNEIGGNHIFSPISGGSYVLNYCTTSGCCVDVIVTVIDLEIEILDLDGACEGDLTGSVEVSSGLYTVEWELILDASVIATAGPSSTATFGSLGAGDYEINATMTTAPFCKKSLKFTITQGGWHKRTENTTGTESANDVVTDAYGNVYVVGTFTETTEIEGGGNPNIAVDSDGSTYGTMFLAKYNDCGTLLWAAHSSGAPLCSGRGLILDEANGMVYVTGELRQAALFHSAESADDLCGSGYNQSLIATSSKSGYVAQYDMATGCLYFAEAFNDGVEQETTSITINENTGDIFVAGSYRPSFSGPEEYVFIRKYTPDVASGTANTLNPIVWARYDNTSGSGQWNRVNNMDYDENRQFLYAIGDYSRRIEISGSVLTHVSELYDAFLLSIRDLGMSGIVFNLRSGNGSNNGFMSGEGVAVNNATGAVYLTGSYNVSNPQPFFFSGINPLMSFSSQSKSYMLAGRVGGTFTPWARNTIAVPFSSGWIKGTDVTFKGNQAIFSNEFSGMGLSVAPGGGPGVSYPFVGNPTGVGHIGIISYTATGTRNWINVTESVSTSSNDDHRSNAVAFGTDGVAFLAGAFRNTMSYSSGSPLSGDLIYSGTPGGYNACVLRIQNSSGSLERSAGSETITDLTANKANVSIWPNPAETFFRIELEAAKETNVSLISVTGQLIQEFTFNDLKISVPIDGLANGTYFVNIKNEDGTTSLPLIIKK